MIASGCSSHPHNLYIEVLSELGVTGLILFLLLLYYTILIPFIKNYKYIKNDTNINSFIYNCDLYFPFRPVVLFHHLYFQQIYGFLLVFIYILLIN